MKRWHVRAIMYDVTGWTRDADRIADAETRGDPDELLRIAHEVRERLEDCDWRFHCLPFEYEFDIVPERDDGRITEEDVKNRVLDEFTDEFLKGAYVVPTDCLLEWEITGEEETE